MSTPAEKYRRLRESIPDEVRLVVASKGRPVEEIQQVLEAGARLIGENYTHPEAVRKYNKLGDVAQQLTWHLIGHLQKNDINKALPIFDVIQTVESFRKAKHIDKRVPKADKETIPTYIEVNSGKEESKYGIAPEFDVLEELLVKIEDLQHLRVRGLMTMGPFTGDPEDARPYFQTTRQLFKKAQDLDLKNTSMNVLSMGMTNSYKVAIE
ncbi:MAG: YggS family pyridoxal phosphate-dependent enzyme, partial [Candidatus Bipolaricaulota bacterium]